MRKLIFHIITIALILTSCKKFMHDEEVSLAKISNYNQLTDAVGGVYGMLAGAINLSANEKGDDINFYNPSYSYYYDSISCWTNNTEKSYPSGFTDESSWQSLYLVIASANNIISQYNIATTHDKKTLVILGEMYFIRAYCHFRLTRIFGRIPIISNKDFSYSTPLATYTEIYRFIENDLKIAMELLPKNNFSARQPFITPHLGSAKAVLAEVYLSHAGYPLKDASQYVLAAKEAGEVIDSASFFGLGLLPNFEYLWNKDHLYSSESVFSLYYPIYT
jgi:hypothetical protein